MSDSNFAPSHWEDPPHDYNHYKDYDGPVIVCDVDGCDWVGTAFASQFSVHSLRQHDK